MERKNVINGEARTEDMSNPWRRVVNYGDYARTWERTPAGRPRHRPRSHKQVPRHRLNVPARARSSR